MTANLPLICMAVESATVEVPTRCPMDLTFSVPMIFDKILKYLRTKDLLHCSAVNSLWYPRSRTILRDFKKCFVRTNRVGTCAGLIPWYMEISEMSIPFNGLEVTFGNNWIIHHSETCVEDQVIPDEFFQKDWPLKYLKISGIQNSCEPKCVSTTFAKRVLKTESLKELEITEMGGYCYMSEPWSVIFSRELTLPFEIAKLPEQILQRSKQQMLPFISSSPNLIKLDCYLTPENVAFIPASSYGVVKKFKFDLTSLRDYLQYYEFFHSGPKLEGLHIENHAPVSDNQDSDFSYLRSLERLLDSSSKSLRFLEVAIPVLVKLPHLNIASLSCLTELKIDVGRSYMDQHALAMLKKFNFTQLFPKLTSVTVDVDSARNSDIFEMESRTNEIDSSQSVDLAANINQVSFQGPMAHVVGYFVRLFPKVTAVELSNGCVSLESFREIWTNWGLLREITIGKDLQLPPGTLDAAFCGISQHEVVELQRRGAGFLEKANIVPNYLGLWRLKHLTKVRLSKELRCANEENGPTLTQVTKLLAFQRMKNVKISYFDY